ncbi:ABC transporter substrate-binding protein [Pseudonocardia sp. CNS-139]|nr:ABC transporter substrate-binding protein [Pseudonocardia sp. CNS-139]
MTAVLNRRQLLRASLLGAGAVALGGGALAACGSDSGGAGGGGAGATEQVGLQLSWTHSVQFGGSYIAADRGFWAGQGLDVTLSPGGPNVAGDAQTVSGQALMNVSSADGVARSNAEGADLRIVGVCYQKNPSVVASLAANPITTPQDLVGARIGVSGTDVPALEAFARINGIPFDGINLVPTQYDPAPLVAGQVDALYCFENDLPVAMSVQDIDNVTMFLQDFGYTVQSQTYTVRADTLADEERRSQLVRLFRGEIQGWQEYRKDPEAAADLAVRMYPDQGLDPATQRLVSTVQLPLLYSDNTDTNGFAWFTDDSVAANIELMGLLGLEAAADMWDRSILEEIYADGPVA